MGNKICTFFGHRDAPDSVCPLLRAVLMDLIENSGVVRFYVGHQGRNDAMAQSVLSELQSAYDIRYAVALAYFPRLKDAEHGTIPTVLPEGIETVPRRFAVEYRNNWMLDNSEFAVTYVVRPFGGAAKFKAAAQKKGKAVIELSERIASDG